MTTKTRQKIGDVIEIDAGDGLAYAHYTHQHPVYGALLRVFGSRKSKRPTNIEEVVRDKPTFCCFVPLAAGLKRNIFAIAGNVDLSDEEKNFPLFRAGAVNPQTGRVATWWLWDGTTEQRVGALTEEMRRLSIRGVWNDTLLKERILSGWTPESDPT